LLEKERLPIKTWEILIPIQNLYVFDFKGLQSLTIAFVHRTALVNI
jgi:hypothetical protein